ncbi:MAG TPA: hypothetical protein VGL66_05435 [Caulobacteraceae bacterium]|jgi:hypothetical protein
MKRAILLLAAVSLSGLALGGCLTRHDGRVIPVGHKPVVMKGAPKAAAGMDWTFAPEGDNAALTYGAMKGGDVKLMLACTHKSGAVTIGEPVAELPEGAKSLILVSGSVKTVDAGEVKAAPSAPDLQVMSVTFNTMAPIVQAFDERGWISIPNGSDHLVHMVPHAGNRAVHQFFSFCG